MGYKLAKTVCKVVLLWLGGSSLVWAQESAHQEVSLVNESIEQVQPQVESSVNLTNNPLVLNIENTSCQQILDNPGSLPFLIAWTDGYLSGVTKNTLTDEEYIRNLSKGVLKYCQAYPQALYWRYIQTYYNVEGARSERP